MAERVGIEPTSARSRTDNGFEDRGDHQAPFTLRDVETEMATPRLLPQGLHGPQHLIRIGKFPRGPLGMDDLSICAHLEHAAVGWNQLERADALLQLHEPARHTDGLGLVVSSRAIFDDNFFYHLVLVLLLSLTKFWHFDQSVFIRKKQKNHPKAAVSG